MFVSTVVVAAVAIVADTRVDPAPFVRDLVFNLIGLAYMAWAFWDNKIHVLEASGFVLIYVAFAMCVRGDCVPAARRRAVRRRR